MQFQISEVPYANNKENMSLQNRVQTVTYTEGSYTNRNIFKKNESGDNCDDDDRNSIEKFLFEEQKSTHLVQNLFSYRTETFLTVEV
jgi:hypothetical protein